MTADRGRQEACPNAAEHNYGPDRYLAWHAWAARMSRDHTQLKCPGCGYWLIWRQTRIKAATR